MFSSSLAATYAGVSALSCLFMIILPFLMGTTEGEDQANKAFSIRVSDHDHRRLVYFSDTDTANLAAVLPPNPTTDKT